MCTMLAFYTKGYHNAFVRTLQSVFINMPLTVWFRFISRLFFWQKASFVNYSGLTTLQLNQIWNQVQVATATQPIQQTTNPGATWPADKRAMNVQPKNLTVVAVPDWSVSDLVKINSAWAGHKTPSGAFGVDTGTDYETVAGITLPWAKPRIYGAASVMVAVLQWEFQNVILSKLEYDVTNR